MCIRHRAGEQGAGGSGSLELKGRVLFRLPSLEVGCPAIFGEGSLWGVAGIKGFNDDPFLSER